MVRNHVGCKFDCVSGSCDDGLLNNWPCSCLQCICTLMSVELIDYSGENRISTRMPEASAKANWGRSWDCRAASSKRRNGKNAQSSSCTDKNWTWSPQRHNQGNILFHDLKRAWAFIGRSYVIFILHLDNLCRFTRYWSWGQLAAPVPIKSAFVRMRFGVAKSYRSQVCLNSFKGYVKKVRMALLEKNVRVMQATDVLDQDLPLIRPSSCWTCYRANVVGRPLNMLATAHPDPSGYWWDAYPCSYFADTIQIKKNNVYTLYLRTPSYIADYLHNAMHYWTTLISQLQRFANSNWRAKFFRSAHAV